ncbi:MAG: tetratricopeptide repeat protein [Candidatus Brocadia sp.]
MCLLFSITSILTIVFMISSSSFAIGKGLEGADSDRVIYEYAERVLQDTNRQYDTDLLRECMGFYLDNQQYDSPQGSYNKAIRLGYQIVNIDRLDIDTYTTMAWLLWSKWVCWTKTPGKMPDGEGKADEAIELLNWGKQWNQKSARFHKESADTIWPLAKYYRTDLYDFVIENYRKADLLSVANDLFKVRVRLNLGHIYRQMGKKRPAMYWYRRVLEIAPSNEIAGRYLAYLENEPDGKTIH